MIANSFDSFLRALQPDFKFSEEDSNLVHPIPLSSHLVVAAMKLGKNIKNLDKSTTWHGHLVRIISRGINLIGRLASLPLVAIECVVCTAIVFITYIPANRYGNHKAITILNKSLAYRFQTFFHIGLGLPCKSAVQITAAVLVQAYLSPLSYKFTLYKTASILKDHLPLIDKQCLEDILNEWMMGRLPNGLPDREDHVIDKQCLEDILNEWMIERLPNGLPDREGHVAVLKQFRFAKLIDSDYLPRFIHTVEICCRNLAEIIENEDKIPYAKTYAQVLREFSREKLFDSNYSRKFMCVCLTVMWGVNPFPGLSVE